MFTTEEAASLWEEEWESPVVSIFMQERDRRVNERVRTWEERTAHFKPVPYDTFYGGSPVVNPRGGTITESAFVFTGTALPELKEDPSAYDPGWWG